MKRPCEPATGPLVAQLGCPPATLAELATLPQDRQQLLAEQIAATRQRQRVALQQALRHALPRALHRLLPDLSRQEP